MLFDAAILSITVAVTPVAEAFALPETSSIVSLSSASSVPLGIGADPTALANLRGMNLLEQLALLPAESIAAFTEANTQVVQQLLAKQPKASDVAAWWGGMELSSRSSLLSSAPALVGNLEGIPVGMRDLANRANLGVTMQSFALSGNAGRAQLRDAVQQSHMLTQVEDALAVPAGEPTRMLLTFDPEGSGTAAVVIGDLATADYVSYLVPGMFYTVDAQVVDWTAAAQAYYDTQVRWIETLAKSDPAFEDATVATVAWLGYETPGLMNFTSLDLAYKGSGAIATAINGIRTLRGDTQPFLTVVAHSYGSTAAMMALTDYGIDIDAFAAVGSPGSSAQHASDLGVAGDNVYVGEADWDQVKDSAFFGSDPGSASFDAHVFSTAGRVDPLTGKQLGGSTGHDEYFVPGSESIRNLALIGLGEGVLITTDSAKGPAAKGVTPLYTGKA